MHLITPTPRAPARFTLDEVASALHRSDAWPQGSPAAVTRCILGYCIGLRSLMDGAPVEVDLGNGHLLRCEVQARGA